ncbi:MAG TPA: SDR family oxidoreductase [Verrucomicrobiales bacterium]|nr:SDR family oxidoreductase [Verrucomicrobiales bacterium]
MPPRTYLVTGASKGIGYATSQLLANHGHRVLGLARSAPQDASPFHTFHPIDLADRAASAALLTSLATQYGIDGILNNVGLVRPAPLEEVSLADLDAVLDLNLRVALQTVQNALPHMKSQRWGRIVNISSLTAAGVPFRTCYAAAKTALISFTRSWALELASSGITVNAVAPGPVATGLFNTNNPPGSESRQRYIDGVPMKRTGEPAEIAAANVFLLSEESSFITGQTLFVDGGSSIGRSTV